MVRQNATARPGLSAVTRRPIIISISIISFVALVLIAGQAGLFDRLLTPGDLVPVDFATLQRPKCPNTYLVAPRGYTPARNDRDAPAYGVPVEKLRANWEKVLAAQPRVTRVAESHDGLQFDFIQRTRLMRYPDWITIRFIPLAAGDASFAIYSRSVYGCGDLGANKARIEAWLKTLDAL